MKQLCVFIVALMLVVPCVYAEKSETINDEMKSFLQEKENEQSQFKRHKNGGKKKASDVDVKQSDNLFKPALLMDKNIPPMPEQILPDPVGEYLFSGNADDTSPEANHGIVTGAVLTEDRGGQENSAYIFYERAHRIEIPKDEANAFSNGSFTVSFWVKTKADKGHSTEIITNQSNSTPFWGFNLTSMGSVSFVLKNQEGQNVFISSPINDGIWHQVTGVRNAENNTMSLYVDGTLIQARTGVSGTVDSGGSIWVGDHKNMLFVGRIDDIRLWNQALNDELLARIHMRETGSPIFATQTMTVAFPGVPDPIGRYMFDGNAEDSSGNGNHGIVTGAELVEDRAGNADRAYLFYERLHRIKIPRTPQNTVASGSFSASFWFRIMSKPICMVYLLTNESGAMPKWNFMFSEQGNVVFSLTNQEGDYAKITCPVSVGEWHHVTGTRNAQNNTMSLYVDSALVLTRPAITGSVDSLGPIFAGDHKNLLYNGRMDEVLLWDRALTESQMAEYHEQTAHLPQTAAYSPDADNIQEPVGLYHFDGNATDASPQHNDAQVNEAHLSQDRFGNDAKAYCFYDRNNRIKVPLILANTFGKGSFSVSLWVKINETINSYDAGIVTNESNHNQKWGVFYSQSGKVVFFVRNKEKQYARAEQDIDLGTWHHVVAVRNASSNTISLFMDGHLAATRAGVEGDLNSEGNIFIGDGKNLLFRGCIDEVTLWRRALSNLEIFEMDKANHPTPVSVPVDNIKPIEKKPANLNHLLPKK